MSFRKGRGGKPYQFVGRKREKIKKRIKRLSWGNLETAVGKGRKEKRGGVWLSKGEGTSEVPCIRESKKIGPNERYGTKGKNMEYTWGPACGQKMSWCAISL